MTRKPDSPADASATPHLAAKTAPAEAGPARSVPLPETADALAADDASHMPGTLDAHGFDPAEFKWVPVRRKPRPDGWSPERQRLFIGILADTGCVAQAADEVGMSVQSAYRLRRAPGAEGFAAAWDAAIAQASRKLVDLAFDRAIHGSDEPVFDREGHRVGRRMRQNDRLLMFLLRAYMPERFRHAHKSERHAEEAPPPAPPPVADALLTLEPVQPPDPHLLMSPEELATELEVAHLMDGELPQWYRDRSPEPVASPLGEEFERQLEAAKREAAGRSPDPEDGDQQPFLA